MTEKISIPRRSFVRTMAAAAAGCAVPQIAGAAADDHRRRPEVAAIHCPLWHRYDHMDAWHGYGWCEWELVKKAIPRFPGHYQPLRPSWGFFDESDPKWSAREIDLAADHNIDVFLFDWYWYSGVRLMEEVVEKAFLKAPNRRRMKFALMWANHEWSDFFPVPYDKPLHSWLPIRHSPADLMRVIDYCIDHYFREPNYWTVDGRLFFSLFRPEDLIGQLGGPAKTKSLLEAIDRKLVREKLPPIHWNGMPWGNDALSLCQKAGFHSTTNYNITSSGKTSANLTQQYEDLIAAHQRSWESLAKTSLPYCPVVTMGWDVTPRCEQNVPFPFPKPNYPYGHVVLGNTPERFERLCRLAAKHVTDDPKRPPAVFINAWNEWTEGSHLLPEARYGTAYLEAVKRAFPRRALNA